MNSSSVFCIPHTRYITMERSNSSYTDYTDYTDSSTPNTSYPPADTLQPYPSSGSSQSFTPAEPQVDVNGELGDFAGLDLMGMEGAALDGMGYDPQWSAAAPQTEYQQPPVQYPPGDYNDSFGVSSNPQLSFGVSPQLFPFQAQNNLINSWTGANLASPLDGFNPGFQAPLYSQPHAYGTDEASTSQPGTGLISPQAIFQPAFVNPQDYHGDHYQGVQPWYNATLVPNHQPIDSMHYGVYQPVVPQSTIAPHAQTPLQVFQREVHRSSTPMSRANSTGDKKGHKTLLSAEQKLDIYQLSKLPNMRQQDVAAKYK
jgi:hypothetical protein